MPGHGVLLPTQKNHLFTVLQARGFAPEDFFLCEDDNPVHLRHRYTQYGCLISVGSFTVFGPLGAMDSHTVPFRLTYSPGKAFLQEEKCFRSWGDVLSGFNHWLDCLDAQFQAPDLWATISGDTQLIRLAADQDNQPFTPDEQTQVKKALDEIKAYLIKTHNLSGDRLEAIERQLSYLEEASSRLGRKDWSVILIGSLLGMVSNLSLSADGTKDLFRFAGQIVKQLLGTILYLAGPH